MIPQTPPSRADEHTGRSAVDAAPGEPGWQRRGCGTLAADSLHPQCRAAHVPRPERVLLRRGHAPRCAPAELPRGTSAAG